jgi:hypothetical protein
VSVQSLSVIVIVITTPSVLVSFSIVPAVVTFGIHGAVVFTIVVGPSLVTKREN